MSARFVILAEYDDGHRTRYRRDSKAAGEALIRDELSKDPAVAKAGCWRADRIRGCQL